MSRSEELQEFASTVVKRAQSLGADAAEVYVRHGLETDIEVRNGEIDKLVEGGPKSVSVRVWRGDRSASTYGTDFSDGVVDRLIRDAVELADLMDPVPEMALADKDQMAIGAEFPDLDLYDSGVLSVSASEKLAIAQEAETVALGHDPRITTSGGAAYGDLVMANALANSHGFCSGYESSFVSVQVEVIADDEGGKKRNGSWYSFARHREDLGSSAEVGRIAAERALRQLGAGPIATGKMPVVFDPWMASSLIGTLFGVLRGSAIERRSSYLVDRVGESIGSSLLTLIDDPLIPRAPGSKPYDGEGLAARRTVFIDEGVLQGYALNSYTARKLGLPLTGHASRPASGSTGVSSSNLFLQAGDRTPESIIADVEYGFYCESMMGFGFNGATGDFSRGASGRLIENGKLTRGVSEITVSGNLNDIFGNLDAVGNDLVFDRSTTAPTIRISEMTVAGS